MAQRSPSTRAVLDLTAGLMEAAFEELGEGVIAATMPAYLQRFGADNARHVAGRYVDCDPDRGAVAALTPMNHVSRVTGTEFTMEQATRNRAVKRLHGCEFLKAFEGRAAFTRHMICSLHAATYQGSVNGLLKDPADGYDVHVGSRILFGEPHCDFEVTSRTPRPGGADEEGKARRHPEEERERLSFDFYTYIMASFIEYMSSMLPAPLVQRRLIDCARRAGADLQAREGFQGTPTELMRQVLEATGHDLAGGAADGVAEVVACPHEKSLRDAMRDSLAAPAARQQATLLCQGVVEGALEQACGSRLPVLREAEGHRWTYRLEAA